MPVGRELEVGGAAGQHIAAAAGGGGGRKVVHPLDAGIGGGGGRRHEGAASRVDVFDVAVRRGDLAVGIAPALHQRLRRGADPAVQLPPVSGFGGAAGEEEGGAGGDDDP